MLSEEQLFKKIEERKREKLEQVIYVDGEFISYNNKNRAVLNSIIKEIIKDKDADKAIDFIIHVEGLPINKVDKLIEVVIEAKNTRFIYQFAIRYETLRGKLSEAIIEIKNAKYIYLFARDVKGAPIEKLSNAIIKTKDVNYIYMFARDIEGAPVQKLVTALNQFGAFDKSYKLSKQFNLPLPRDIEYNYGIQVLAEEQNKSDVLDNLIGKALKENSKEDLIKLRIYFEFLSNENSTVEDAIVCDAEYLEYMKNCEEQQKVKKNNKK